MAHLTDSEYQYISIILCIPHIINARSRVRFGKFRKSKIITGDDIGLGLINFFHGPGTGPWRCFYAFFYFGMEEYMYIYEPRGGKLDARLF